MTSSQALLPHESFTRFPCCSGLFLGLIKVPVSFVPTCHDPGGCAWAVSNPPSSAGPEPRAAPAWGEHGEDPRFATARARRHAAAIGRDAPLSHGRIQAAAAPRRSPPDRDRSSLEGRLQWNFRTGFPAAPRTTRRIQPGPRATRPTRRSSASTGLAAPSWGVWWGAAVEAQAFWRDGALGALHCSARRDLRADGHSAELAKVPAAQPLECQRRDGFLRYVTMNQGGQPVTPKRSS